jgi:hypothetical protein
LLFDFDIDRSLKISNKKITFKKWLHISNVGFSVFIFWRLTPKILHHLLAFSPPRFPVVPRLVHHVLIHDLGMLL